MVIEIARGRVMASVRHSNVPFQAPTRNSLASEPGARGSSLPVVAHPATRARVTLPCCGNTHQHHAPPVPERSWTCTPSSPRMYRASACRLLAMTLQSQPASSCSKDRSTSVRGRSERFPESSHAPTRSSPGPWPCLRNQRRRDETTRFVARPASTFHRRTLRLEDRRPEPRTLHSRTTLATCATRERRRGPRAAPARRACGPISPGAAQR
jgi:hypothetical protein